jgi:hypothetical protein
MSCNKAYKQQWDELQKKLAQLRAKLDDHAAKQARQPDDWGYVGDLAHFNRVIDQLIA